MQEDSPLASESDMTTGSAEHPVDGDEEEADGDERGRRATIHRATPPRPSFSMFMNGYG